ncbi:LapA family protein [Vibrio alfacsensis]|uniref:LapA family protein n=1 Tax=Vibrio alfacsensis TaxID=1074311 RepID=UPI0040697E5C
MKIIKIIAVLALFLIALALGSQNQEIVTFNYLLAQGEFHLSTLLGVVFVVGFALAWVIFASIQFKTQLQVRRLKKKLKKYEPAAEAEKPAKPAIEKQA